MTGTSKARSKWHTAPNLWTDKSSAAEERRLHWFGLTNRFHVAVRLFSNRSQMTWADDMWAMISLVAMRSKELRLIEKNRVTVKPDPSVALCWKKTYSERRIELRNPQILKKMLEKSSQFLSSEQPCQCEPKSLDVALKITGVEKIPLENLWLRSTKRPFDSSFEWKERKWRWRSLCSVVGDSQKDTF